MQCIACTQAGLVMVDQPRRSTKISAADRENSQAAFDQLREYRQAFSALVSLYLA